MYNGGKDLCLEYMPVVQNLNWIFMNSALVQWESDLWTLTAIRSYYSLCKFSHNDCKKTCNGKINHRSMHLLRRHQWQEKSVCGGDQYHTATVKRILWETGSWLAGPIEWSRQERNNSAANDEGDIYCGDSLNQYSQNKIKLLDSLPKYASM